jgi:uncharacterized membrane protein YkvA (DUF1232 family)
MWNRLLRVVALLRDPRTPALPRLAVLVAVLYLLSPVDLIPGSMFPIVGWLDDLTVVWLALRWLVKSVPAPDSTQASHLHP